MSEGRILWRISNHDDLTGLGGERSNGRWHTAARGKRIVYLAEHPAVALVEALANLEGDPDLFPDGYQLIKAAVSAEVSTETVDISSLPVDWPNHVGATQTIGDLWLAEQRSVLLVVPSVPSPESLNYVFNPEHAGATGLVKLWSKRVAYDKRLFRLK